MDSAYVRAPIYSVMDTTSVHIVDCVWTRNKVVDAYTHLRLLKNGWKSHDFKVSFSKNSTGGSTGWDFWIDALSTYSIEVYTSARNRSGMRRIAMDWQEYEIKTLLVQDLRNVLSSTAGTCTPSKVVTHELRVGNLGAVTLHIDVPLPSMTDHLDRANSLKKSLPINRILRLIERLEPFLEPLSTIGDVVGELHPITKGIVGSLRAIHKMLKSVSELSNDIGGLLEEMCIMLHHVEKIKGCTKEGVADDFKDTFVKMEALMSQACQFVQRWHDCCRSKGALLASLSREQKTGIRKLKSEFMDLKHHLDRQIAVDVLVRTRQLSDVFSYSSPLQGDTKSISPVADEPPPCYDSVLGYNNETTHIPHHCLCI